MDLSRPSTPVGAPVLRPGDSVPTEFPSGANRQLRWHAYQLENRHSNPAMDRDDYYQELSLNLCRQLPRYDGKRSSLPTFSDRVLISATAHISRNIQATKRNPQSHCHSLDAPTGNETYGSSLGNSLADSQRTHHRGIATLDDRDRRLLQTDLQVCLSQLTPLQQKVCRYLANVSERETARRSGISRYRLRQEMAAIRNQFTRGDLQEYLKNSQPD